MTTAKTNTAARLTQMGVRAAMALACCGAWAGSSPAAPVDFNREIRPILSQNCFKCHGPDEAARKSRLRLDIRSEALKPAKSDRPAIVPGKPEASELIARITAVDEEDRMPPVSTGKKLSSAQIEALRHWIAQGAAYAPHWAYVKPTRPALPAVRKKNWPLNGVDAFVLARLEREGLKPSTRADRYTLLRRVSLDLIGLPPPPEIATQFLSDPRPEAYERLVDRFLDLPAFGEHWSRLWLDLARYADSAGYADDPPRTIWAYRDYVIQSLNRNKPFDRFTIEQIAGDLLPEPTEEELVATAFHRNTMTNSEGGTDDEEFRNAAVVDRVNTTMAVWMGTSMACAQCHTHKFDPISQREYFSMFAIFNNTMDADRKDEAPVLELYTAEQKEQRSQWEAEITRLEQSLKRRLPELELGQRRWEAGFPLAINWTVIQAGGANSSAGPEAGPGAEIELGTGEKARTNSVVGIAATKRLTGFRLSAWRLPTDPASSQPTNSALVISRVTVKVLSGTKETPVRFSEAYVSPARAGFDPATVLEGTTGKGWKLAETNGTPNYLTLIPEQPVELDRDGRLEIGIVHSPDRNQLAPGRVRVEVTDEPAAPEHARTPEFVLDALGAATNRTASQQALVDEYYRTNVAPELAAERKRLADLKGKLASLKPETVPIFRELPEAKKRTTRLQYRGNYQALGEEVSAGVPAVFHSLPATRKPDRLALAEWLIAPENPLTARVTANRLWEQLFGIGIVRTSEDFGSQGDLPTNPELLDWLATELVAQKWDLKKFLKMLVTSATYCQCSQVTPEGAERDPENLLLGRGPRSRMPAEVVRDQALAVSGLLSSKMYGPPVRPVRPALGLSAAFGGSLDWKTSEGEDRYRRALYIEWRRTSLYPSLATFDAPAREVCALRRPRSNTPLQALVTLNDPVFVEAAQALGRKMAEHGGSIAEKAAFGFERCLIRPARKRELSRLVALYEQAAKDFQAAPEKARQAAGASEKGLEPVEVAAWTMVANVLLNLDEMLMRP